MSEQSKMTNEEAFEKWAIDYGLYYEPSFTRYDVEESWQAAIAYMQEQSEPVGKVEQMSRDIIFSVSDVKALAEFVMARFHVYNSNGADYCSGCGCELDFNTSAGNHESDCVTKIAQDVLTGLED